jgi:Holliday junction resolvasome RuvABC endonuclease subunit
MGVAVWSEASRSFVEMHVLSTKDDSSLRYVAENNVQALNHLVTELVAIIRRRNPSVIVAEMPHGGAQSSRAASCMAMAFAIVVATANAERIRLHMVSPSDVKKLVDSNAGKKKVDKKKVISWVQERYGTILPPTLKQAEHVADAIAAGTIYLNSLSGRDTRSVLWKTQNQNTIPNTKERFVSRAELCRNLLRGVPTRTSKEESPKSTSSTLVRMRASKR